MLSGLLPRGGYLFALAVLLGSLALVFATWQNARERELHAAELEFVGKTDEVVDLIRQRLVNYELVTRGGAALFASVARPTPRQWQAYVEGMQIGERFPAMLGLGFAGYVSGGGLGELQLEWRDAGYGILDVRPHGRRPFYGPILYLEPRTIANVQAVGFDMYSEATRQAAMQAAAESGEARMTGSVHLIQDAAEKKTGLLLYLPVYRGGDRPASVAARRESLQGWVYVPFRLDPFLAAALGSTAYRDARFRVYDITGGAEELLFTTAIASGEEAPAFQHSTTVESYGRQWRVEFDSPPESLAAPKLQGLQNMLGLGLFASLLMYGLAWMLARTEGRAQAIATRMTEEYRRSELRFRVAMQYSAIGKALLDSEGRIVEANPALAAIVGQSPDVLAGSRFDALFEDDDTDTRTTRRFVATDEQGVYRSTRRLHREGGVPRHAQLTFAPVPGNIDQDIAGLVQVEDVTERVRAEARVHALNRTLEARVALRTRELSLANQELEAFAYTISHDLRAPLRAIDGFSRILFERYAGAVDEHGRDYLGRVRKAAARMGELIDAMLKMSRLTRSELKLERIDLSQVATEILEEQHLADPGRVVERHIQPGLEVTGDAALLRNLMSNLLVNAWKFTRDQPAARVEVGFTDDADGGEFFVRDNGAGFSQDYVDKLFRPFQRLHSQGEFAGHGIGLASVKRIVERHGGMIRAEGREGQGATFYFTLPNPTRVE
ncbi:CHASE domain-containing protein [Lysobacter koreensis]|uniref:histidine kinase n=1 Tax=Lysobacter koreensis TaxID=266122 RepID=A0ABW2YIH8_9GAMM